MNHAIVCLTRGYTKLEKYATLISRNQSIKEFINKDNQYPLIIFHEGDITEEHQDYITHFSDGQRIVFKDISSTWSGGYEGMCRFNIVDMFQYVKDYDAVLRIDEDCIITGCETNPFEQIGENVYLRSVYWGESHSETNATLPQFIQGITGANPESFYNNKFPYTNVSMIIPSFWLNEPLYPLIRIIGYSDLQRQNRWGDLPVLGALLNIFAEGRVGAMTGLKYKHLSHGTIIECK